MASLRTPRLLIALRPSALIVPLVLAVTTVMFTPAAVSPAYANAPLRAAGTAPYESAVTLDVAAAATPADVARPSFAVARAADAAAATGTVIWPFPESTMGDPFGPRIAPCAGCSTFHHGIDLLGGNGSAVRAAAAGVVTTVSYQGTLGLTVDVEISVGGQQWTTVYGHLAAGSPTVHTGEAVAVGQTLARVGSTGLSTGPHLFFGLDTLAGSAVDPVPWLREYAG